MKPLPLANSLALVTALGWVACALFVWFLPELSLTLTQTWMMGLQGLNFTGWNLDVNTFLIGGVSLAVSAWLLGYVWGWLYEKLAS